VPCPAWPWPSSTLRHAHCSSRIGKSTPMRRSRAVSSITRDAKVGRAEALCRAMLDMIDKGEPDEGHPAYWAPFVVVVGEGAAAKKARQCLNC
jgi:hypothetical protein